MPRAGGSLGGRAFAWDRRFTEAGGPSGRPHFRGEPPVLPLDKHTNEGHDTDVRWLEGFRAPFAVACRSEVLVNPV